MQLIYYAIKCQLQSIYFYGKRYEEESFFFFSTYY